jgi:RNA polymerase sigma factor (sigma-70 family)
MKTVHLSVVEKAFVSYMKKRLDGRSLRLKKKWDTVSKTEIQVLNEPCYQEEDSMEKVDQISKQEDLPFDEQIANRLVVGKAMEDLTDRETLIIQKLFWEQMRVKDLCEEMDVSKTAVLKTKRNALQKIKRALVV